MQRFYQPIPTFLNCPYPNDGTITITTLGAGYEYSKDNGSTWQPLNAFIGLSAGSYNIKIRNIATNCEIAYAANPVILINPLCIEMCTDNIDNDGDGKIDCDDSDCAALTIPAVVATSPVLVPNDGVILITNLGLGYEYSIDSGMTWQSLNLFSNLTGGTYHARVRNTISGCISDFKDNPIILTLLIPIEICVDGIDNDGDGKIDCADSDCGILNFSSVLSTNPTLLNCPNPNDGTITVLSLGILYEYSIDNGATWQVNPIFTGLTEGSYNVKARSTLTNCTITYPSNPVVLTKFCIEICIDGIDNDGDGAVDCFDSDCINTTNATLSADKMAVCSTGSIATITAMGGGTYKWNTGDSTAVIQTMTAGLYIVTVTNGIGCTNITQIYIDSTYAKATKAYISPGLGTTLLGFNGASYLWSTADTTRSIYMTQAGTYTVTITGVDGCTEIRNIVITEKLPFEVSCDEMPLYNISAGTVLQGAQTLSWESLDGVPIVGHSALDTVITVDLSRTKPDSIYKFLRIIDLAGVKDSDCYQLHVMDCNTKPILTSGILIVNEDTPDSLCLNFVDPDANQNHIATLCNTPAHGTVTTSVQAGQVCITYTPDANYHGLDTICLVLCDDDIRGAKCDSVLIPVIINSINDAPTLTDTLHEVVKTAIPKIICTTITDVDLLDNRRVSTVCSAQHGRAIPSVIGDQLCLTYVSRLRYVGADTVCLKVCDNSGDCDTIIYVIDVVKNCVSMDLKVMLEGPYDPATGKMRTTLNQRGLLPGQTPVGVLSTRNETKTQSTALLG